jgi:hypothetical protein
MTAPQLGLGSTEMNDDVQHLRLLSVFHYILAAMTALVGCFPLIHLAAGIAMLSGALPVQPNDGASSALAGWVFVGVAIIIITAAWSFAVVLLFAARYLREHRHCMFCLIVAGLECMFMPFGTVLGVFTIIVLLRPSVRKLFGEDGDSTVS